MYIRTQRALAVGVSDMKFKNSWDKLKSDKKEIAFAKHIKYMKVDHKLKKIKGDKNSEGDE